MRIDAGEPSGSLSINLNLARRNEAWAGAAGSTLNRKAFPSQRKFIS